MGHNITALVLQGTPNLEAIKEWGAVTKALPFDLYLVFIDPYYTSCWQKMKLLEGELQTTEKPPILFPTDIASSSLAQALTGEQSPLFAIIHTDYFGGAGEQFAQLYKGTEVLDLPSVSISEALEKLGVEPREALDAFETVGLTNIRQNPECLEKYSDLADELGI